MNARYCLINLRIPLVCLISFSLMLLILNKKPRATQTRKAMSKVVIICVLGKYNLEVKSTLIPKKIAAIPKNITGASRANSPKNPMYIPELKGIKNKPIKTNNKLRLRPYFLALFFKKN